MYKVKPIAAFEDNYIWALINEDKQHAIIVDPGDAELVVEFLEDKHLTLQGILITHWHPDHTGGIESLKNAYNIPVLGPDSPHISGVTQPVKNGHFQTLGLDVEVIEVPGHTLEHIAYFFPSENILFSGDTLFAGGCGRVFEGSVEQMHGSLMKLASLPANTKIFCAHEYTLANRAFAHAVEPNNAALIAQTEQDKMRRQHNKPTVPSTLATELACNPFLRVSQPEVIASARQHAPDLNAESGAEVFAILRKWKDTF
jgi:hydroxyacylglutathione hydrolase